MSKLLPNNCLFFSQIVELNGINRKTAALNGIDRIGSC